MKTLYLIRHAKSDWADEHIRDVHRPLNTRGYSDAYILSKSFAKETKRPELIITSPAIRAYTTACIFAKELGYPLDAIRIREKIYEAPSDAILSSIAETEDSISSLLVFGHNPGFTDTFNQISDSFADNIPTCGIVGIHLDISNWAELFSAKGKCFYTVFPKDFKQ